MYCFRATPIVLALLATGEFWAAAQDRKYHDASYSLRQQDIYAINPDGSGLRALTLDAAREKGSSFSPDGNQIAYSAQRGLDDLFVLSLDKPVAEALTNTRDVSESNPSWSPDGKKIAFTRREGEDFNIAVIQADGGGVTQLTFGSSDDGYPTWSPDGKSVAFASHQGGMGQIMIVGADGAGLRSLTNNSTFGVSLTQPDWSMSSGRIAFVAKSSEFRDLFVMNADGSGLVNLTNGLGMNDQPAWSPDGAMIAFRRAGESASDIFVMRSDGSGAAKLSAPEPEHVDQDPVWSPDGSTIVFTSLRISFDAQGRVRNPAKSALYLYENGGIGMTLNDGSLPPVSYVTRDAAGKEIHLPLSQPEAQRILNQRGLTRVKLDRLYGVNR